MLCLGVGVSFGQDAVSADTNSIVDNLATWLHFLISALSWAWVGLAALAGKLMTNDLVFGGAFHMDVYLFKIRTIMKNLANFGLGFGFIAFVGYVLWSDNQTPSTIVKQIWWFLLAWLLVNVSFFVTQALVDISTIGVTAMGWLSDMFVGSSQSSSRDIITSLASTKTKLTYQQNGKILPEVIDCSDPIDSCPSPESLLDAILPKWESMAWPLLYLGTSILNIQWYTLLQDTNQAHINDRIKGKNLALTALIQIGIVGAFTLALLVLVIANIVRIGMIWILVALWPLFFLLRWLKWWGVTWVDKIITSFGLDKHFAFSSFMQMIFLPVFSILMLSLALIFSTTLWSTLQSPETIHQWIGITADGTNTQINSIIDLTYDGHFINDSVKNTFVDLIVALVTIVLVWLVAKMSIPSKAPIIWSLSKNIFALAEKAMGSARIISLPGKDGRVGLSALGASLSPTNEKGNSINPLAMGKKLYRNQKGSSQQNVEDAIADIFGIKEHTFTDQDLDDITRSLNQRFDAEDKSNRFFDTIKEKAQNKNKQGHTFEVSGKRLFTDPILSKLQTQLRNDSESQLNWLPYKEDDISVFYKNQQVIRYILGQLKKRGLVPENNTKPTDLASLKNTVFVLK